MTRSLPWGDFVDRLQSFSFHHLCYPNYGALTSTPAGLSPAEHASLHWTHNRTGRSPASGLYGACMGLCLSRRHHVISVVLCYSILLFDLHRKHSLVPTAYLHRRRAQRRSRTALLQRRRRLVLDGREHGGRLLAIGWLARAMIRGEPAIGHEQSPANRACIRLNHVGSRP